MTNRNFILVSVLAAIIWGFACVGVYETFVDDDADVAAMQAAQAAEHVAAEVALLREDVEVLITPLTPGDSFTETITTSATKIEGGGRGVSYQCTVDSGYAGTLYIGGINVSSSLYRKTATGGDVFQADMRWEYAISSSGNATLYCGESIR